MEWEHHAHRVLILFLIKKGEKKIGIVPFLDYQFVKIQDARDKCRQDRKDKEKILLEGIYYYFKF